MELEFVPGTANKALLSVDDDEARRIWFALDGTKTRMLDQAKEYSDKGTNIEDQQFLLLEAGWCARMQFDLLENHEPAKAKVVKDWLKV